MYTPYSMKEQVEQLLNRIRGWPMNDPRIIEDLEKIEGILSQSPRETIEVLNALDEDSISWIAPLSISISPRLQSREFIGCISALSEKYPNIPYIKDDVERARKSMVKAGLQSCRH
jgi:hypothetical protein